MRVQVNNESVTLWASASDTYDWAHRSGAAWPGSSLSGQRFCATFDSNGLCDLSVNGQDAGDIDGHELSAICADLLTAKLTADHPVWDVAVGQFQE